MVPDGLDAVRAGLGGEAVEAGLVQDRLEQVPDVGVVLDDDGDPLLTSRHVPYRTYPSARALSRSAVGQLTATSSR